MSSIILRNVPRLVRVLNRTHQIQRYELINCRFASTSSSSSVSSSSSSTDLSAVPSSTSSSAPSIDNSLADFVIPEPPPPPELLPLAPVTAKTFGSSLWLPTGWICSTLLYLEDYMSYSAAIMAVTLVGRIILAPVLVFSQKQSAKMSQVNPIIQACMKQRREAEQRGDKEAAMKAAFKLSEAYKSTDAFKLRKMAISPVCSMAVFGSFFITLRKMANAGHEPMKEGGFATFLDLTVPDSSYLLATWTALSLFGIIKLGTEFGTVTSSLGTSPMQDLMRKASQFAIPCVIFYASTKMPSAVGLYWATSNTISIGQTLVMFHPAVRSALKIPPMVRRKNEKKGIVGSVVQSWKDLKTAWKNMVDNRTARKVNNEYLNQFERSGVGPLQKTYDYDPTKVKPQSKS